MSTDDGRWVEEQGGVASYHIQELDDVWTTAEILQNLNLTFNLPLFDRFENLDDTPGAKYGKFFWLQFFTGMKFQKYQDSEAVDDDPRA